MSLNKKVIRLSDYRAWCESPVTKAMQELFKDIYYKDTADTIRKISANDSSEKIAMRIANLKGRNTTMGYFFEEDSEGELLLKSLLENENVDWVK